MSRLYPLRFQDQHVTPPDVVVDGDLAKMVDGSYTVLTTLVVQVEKLAVLDLIALKMGWRTRLVKLMESAVVIVTTTALLRSTQVRVKTHGTDYTTIDSPTRAHRRPYRLLRGRLHRVALRRNHLASLYLLLLREEHVDLRTVDGHRHPLLCRQEAV